MTKVMAIWIGLAAVLGASLFAGARPARAVEYPWCFLDMKSGGQNCGFTNFEQCRATLAGIGGVCAPNPSYRPEATPRQNARPSR